MFVSCQYLWKWDLSNTKWVTNIWMTNKKVFWCHFYDLLTFHLLYFGNLKSFPSVFVWFIPLDSSLMTLAHLFVIRKMITIFGLIFWGVFFDHPLSHILQPMSLRWAFVFIILGPLLPSGGSGGHSTWWGERSDVQGVLAVGFCGESSDAAGSPVGSP